MKKNLLLIFCCLAGPLAAQNLENIAASVPVEIQLNANQLHSPYTNPFLRLDLTDVAGAQSSSSNGEGVSIKVKLRPGKVYLLRINERAIGGQNLWGQAFVPAGYQVHVGLTRRDSIESAVFHAQGFNASQGTNEYLCFVSVSPAGVATALAPGTSTSFNIGRLFWQVGLGHRTGGRSAGRLVLLGSGAGDWSDLASPTALGYLPDAVWTTNGELTPSPDGTINLSSAECRVRIVTVSASSYRVDFYTPGQGTLSGGNWSYSGAAFISYLIERLNNTSHLRITKTVRAEDAPTNASAATVQTTVTELVKSGTSWMLADWHTSGQTAPSVTTWTESVSGSGVGATRTLDITRKDGANVVAEVSRRIYKSYAWGEELWQHTRGFGTANLTTEYDYYTDPLIYDTYQQVKSVSRPDGKWEGFTYVSHGGSNGLGVNLSSQRLIRTRRGPWGDSPGTITLSGTSGEITTYAYESSPISTHFAQPRSIVRTINNQQVSRSELTYADSTINDRPVTTVIRQEYVTTTQALTSIVKFYNESPAAPPLSGKTYMERGADGVQRSHAYEFGTWDGTTFTPDAVAFGDDGVAVRHTIWRGTNNSSAGDALSAAPDGKTIETIYLVRGQSTKDITIQNTAGRTVRTERHIYTDAGMWALVEWANYTFNLAGRVVNRERHDGATYSASYTGDFKTAEIGETGVTTNYINDAAWRVDTVTVTGIGNIPSLTTKYTYDGAHLMRSRTLGWSQTGALVSQWTYDTAGRLTSETAPGGYTTNYHYTNGGRTVTVTRPDTQTEITDHYLDGRTKSRTGSGIVAVTYMFSTETDGRMKVRTEVGGGATRFHETWTDMLGRTVSSLKPGFTGQPNFIEVATYDTTTGRLAKTAQLDGSNNRLYADVLYQYDDLGHVIRQGADLDNSGTLVLNSADRITDFAHTFESLSSAWWQRTTTTAYPYSGSSTPVTLGITRQRLTGLTGGLRGETRVTNAEGLLTTTTITVNTTNRTVTTSTTTGGLSGASTAVTTNGLLTSSTSNDNLTTTFAYDAFWRRTIETDGRNNATTTSYVPGTRLVNEITDGTSTKVVGYTYDGAGRVGTTSDALDRITRFSYTARGQLHRQWGNAAMPVEYAYTNYGELETQKTYRNGSNWNAATWPASTAGDADMTTWSYHGASGLLASKTAVNTTTTPSTSHTTSFSYNARGQTAMRTWARGTPAITTTYRYSGDAGVGGAATGELHSIVYSDGTPGVSYTYTRMGQVATIADATGTRTFTYDATKPWRLQDEALPSSYYGTRYLSAVYETGAAEGRYRGFKLGASSGSSSELEQVWTYTAAGRYDALATKRVNNTVSRTFQYGYLTNSRLVSSVAVAGGHAFAHYRDYEPQRDLLLAARTNWSTAPAARFDYTSDAAYQRRTMKLSGAAFADYTSGQSYDGVYHVYGYNSRGEIESDRLYRGTTPTATPNSTDELPGRRQEYRYDSAGNRLSAGATGTTSATSGVGDDDYTVNGFNQYTGKENNHVPVAGTVSTSSAVTVNGTPQTKVDRTWGTTITPANATQAEKNIVTVTATLAGAGANGSNLVKTDLRGYFVPKRAQTFGYDADGNLLHDSVWDYTWDAENRLVAMQHRPEVIGTGMIAAPDARRLEFAYDYLGRRVRKTVRGGWNGTIYTGAAISDTKFIYARWDLVAELNALSSNALARSYTWGLDIAGSTSATGGVGALLQIHDSVASQTLLPAHDVNGNVTALLDAEAGSLTLRAVYEYTAFGELTRSEGTYAAANRFRFSGKYQDSETGLLYYGHRYYSPTLGRFINRDPIGEAGGLNLYGFVGNNGINRIDVLGLQEKGPSKVQGHSPLPPIDNSAPDPGPEARTALLDLNRLEEIGSRYRPEAITEANASNLRREQATDAPNSRAEPDYYPGGDMMGHIQWRIRKDNRPPATEEVQITVATLLLPGGAYAILVQTARGRLILYWIGVSEFLANPDDPMNAVGILPTGINAEQFRKLAKVLHSNVGRVSDDIVIQGSRAAGAGAASDIDIAIRVTKEQFDELIKKSFGTPKPGSALEATMKRAMETGKIQAGEARIEMGQGRLSKLRREIEKLLGIETDLSVVLKDGPFDNGPTIPLPR